METGLGSDFDHREISEEKNASALWIKAKGKCEIRHERLPARGPDDVLVKTIYSGISRGTESLVFNGLIPASEFARMRGPHMEGEFSFPVKYGYACVGEVIEGPEHLKGRAVFCLHPHQNLFMTTREMVSELPPDLPPRRAVLAANMETALNIIWDAGVSPGDRVAVFGAGVVGSLVAYLSSRIPGTETRLIDSFSDRQTLAASMGVVFREPPALDGEFDILINASASAEALSSAIDHAAMEARIVEASWYGEKTVTIPLGGAFHVRRLSIVSSQVGTIPADRAPRWTYRRRLAKALELLLDPVLDNLISGETAFSEMEHAYPRILSSRDTLCHTIRY